MNSKGGILPLVLVVVALIVGVLLFLSNRPAEEATDDGTLTSHEEIPGEVELAE